MANSIKLLTIIGACPQCIKAVTVSRAIRAHNSELARGQISGHVIRTYYGGMQKEAYFHAVPCITLWEETGWVAIVVTGWNELAGPDRDRITAAFRNAFRPAEWQPSPYGDGCAAARVLEQLR